MINIAARIYKALGWKVNGVFPMHIKKMVVIAAPHTSWHDFYMALLFRSAIGVKINFLGKKELFKWPFGWYLTNGISYIQALYLLHLQKKNEEYLYL